LLDFDYVNGGLNGLLTPYTVKIFEQNVTSGVETLVYTSAQYGGNAFSLTEFVQLPNISNNPNKRYNAKIDLPNIGIGVFDQPFRRWRFFLNITTDTGGAPILGINGFEPTSQTFGTPGHILRATNIYDNAYNNYRAVISPVEVKWKPIVGFDNISAHIDPWTLQEKGVRIFPDFKTPLNNQLRNRVELVVKTDPSLVGKTVHVKAFDVDDTTSEALDTDDGSAPPVIDTNAKAGNDNFPDYLNTPQSGQFWTGSSWGGDTAQGIVDANGEAKFFFRAGMQPGNNYRVVASPVDTSMYQGVQVTSPTGAKFFGAELNQNAGAPASPLLTVWRKLWVENDSMAAIPVDGFGYKRNDLSSDLVSPEILSVSSAMLGTTTYGIPSGILDQDSYLTLGNSNNLGSMIVQSLVHPVVSTSPFTVTVLGNQTNVPINSEFRLYDDDDHGLNSPPLPHLTLVNELMKSFFRPGFIEIVDSGGMNLNKIIPFKKNDDLQGSTLVNSNNDLLEKDGVWVAPITSAYQFSYTSDGEPNIEIPTLGATRSFGTNQRATVFVENCRESYESNFRTVDEGGVPEIGDDSRLKLKDFIVATAAHEIGHEPENTLGPNILNDHNELGLMSEGGALPASPEDEKFTAKSFLRFRKTRGWSN
jgi:hypothetical protein